MQKHLIVQSAEGWANSLDHGDFSGTFLSFDSVFRQKIRYSTYYTLEYQSLLEHFKCTSIKARFTKTDITFMHSVHRHRFDCNYLVSLFPLHAPSRRSRHPGLFCEPFGRVNTVKNGFLARLPGTCNQFLQRTPQADFFHPSKFFRSQVANYSCSLRTYIG